MKQTAQSLLMLGAAVLLLMARASAEAPNLDFAEYPIDGSFQGISCVYIADLDLDGDMDIVGGSEWTPWSSSIGIAWWRNEGGSPPTWTRFAVDASFRNVMSVEVAFIDKDLFPDIVATSWDFHQIAWFSHTGDPTSTWTKAAIESSFINAHDAECYDIDDDGHVDVVGINSTPGGIMVCYQTGADPPLWTTQDVTSAFDGGKSVDILDFDHDGDPDLVAAAADADQISWWENSGGQPIVWLQHDVTSSFNGSHDFDPGHINGDGLYDLIATAYLSGEVAYFTCDDLTADLWTQHTITSQLGIATKALGRDFDRDGDLDIVAVGKDPGHLLIYENDDFSWLADTLRMGYLGGWALACHDFDGDLRPDIVGGASALGTLSLWMNHSVSAATGETPRPAIQRLSNHPNPFMAATTISLLLPRRMHAELAIYDATGHLVKRLIDGELREGLNQVIWNGTDASGRSCGSGTFFSRLRMGKTVCTRALVRPR
ncbi:MAG: VCBS repeat-containing protein [Candidatus Eisenbacteria sp.]|nr:VCBS repeat-containing protein [Candidatus Eisenbacteria bacterium]